MSPETRICAQCGKEQLPEEYYENNKARCKTCVKEASRQRYASNPDVRQDTKRRAKETTRKLREWVWKYKSEHPCEECGQTHIACLQFHHKDPTQKEFKIADIGKTITNMKKIIEEVKKCKVLCANCHSILHWNEDETKKSTAETYLGLAT